MKYYLIFIATVFGLSGCTQADTTLKQKLFKPVIEKQCIQELKQSKLWKVSSYVMAESAQQIYAQEVCGCVSEHALTDISSQDLLHASINEEVKNQLIQKALLNSVKACILQTKQ